MQFEAGEVRHPHERGRVTRDDLFGRPSRWKFQRCYVDPRRPRLGCALLEKEFAVDAVRIPHQDVGPIAGAAQRAVGHGEVVARQIQFRVTGLWEEAPYADWKSARHGRPTVSSSCSVRPTAAHYKGRRRNLCRIHTDRTSRLNRASPTCCVRRDAANCLAMRATPWCAGEVETARTSSIRSSPSVRPPRSRRTRYGDTPEVRGTAGRAEPELAVQVHSSRLTAYADGFSVPRCTVHQASGHPGNFRAMNVEAFLTLSKGS